MWTFRTLERQIGLVPASLTRTIGAIDTARGREEAFRRQRPQVIDTLTKVARVQSTEASNAIERVHAPRRRIEALVREGATPRNRPEAEIAGYRVVLDTIHTSAPDIPFTPAVVEQLHRDLYRFTSVRAGRWKPVDNAITEELPDGRSRLRFETLAASATPGAMEELHERCGEARARGDHHQLLLAGCYVFDFLAIHPFLDGNGRMARLLTLLLLYQAGYGVGRYVSLERLVSETRDSYYDALEAAGRGWHGGEHDVRPWLDYLLGVVKAAYDEFERRVGTVSGPGGKTGAIAEFVRSGMPAEFTVAEVREAVPDASGSLISKVLADLRDEGRIEPLGRGRGARWRRLRD